MSKNPIEEKARDLYRSGRYASIGLELGVSVVIGILSGSVSGFLILLDCLDGACSAYLV